MIHRDIVEDEYGSLLTGCAELSYTRTPAAGTSLIGSDAHPARILEGFASLVLSRGVIAARRG